MGQNMQSFYLLGASIFEGQIVELVVLIPQRGRCYSADQIDYYTKQIRLNQPIILQQSFISMSKGHNSFGFLKEGNDRQFDKAMKSIDSMYDNLFNGDQLDQIFQSLKVENNPIIEPIDEMSKDIFQKEQVEAGPKYTKVHTPQQTYDHEDEFVVGEPLYQNSNVYPGIANPYANSGMGAQNYPNINPYGAGSHQFVSNNYYNSDTGSHNYFGVQNNSAGTKK